MSNVLLVSIEQTFKEIEATIKLKNQDYAGSLDPFKNFRQSAEVAGITVERGILVRIMDKITRISNLLERKEVVLDEKVTDSLDDCIAYLAILKAYLENK